MLPLHAYMFIHRKIGLLCLLAVCVVSTVRADERIYRWEFGLEGGCGYYVGDATDHIFQNVREMYGGSVRYRFDQRWALQVKGIAHRITGPMPVGTVFATSSEEKWTNQLVNIDMSAEFNFFRFGEKTYDVRVKPLTPYLSLGIGLGLHDRFNKVTGYVPIGLGVKWKFADRWNLKLAWMHNIYFTDDLEGVPAYDNPHKLNGSNILNCDLTGTLSVGVSVEFGKDKKVCKMCGD